MRPCGCWRSGGRSRLLARNDGLFRTREWHRDLEATMAAIIECVQPVLGAGDVEASIAFYARLGFAECFRDVPSSPRYAAVRRDGVELHLQWHDMAGWPPAADRPVYRFVVQDVDGLHAELVARGVQQDITPVRDTAWGTREFHVRDPDRNGLQFYRGV